MLFAKTIIQRLLDYSRKLKTKEFKTAYVHIHDTYGWIVRSGRLQNAKMIFQDLLIKGYQLSVCLYSV